MGKFEDKTGKKINNLLVLKYLGASKWLCKCDCGNETIVCSALLNDEPNRRKRKSCGCLKNKNKPKNEDFFEIIDSESKGYIFGFIAADGCIQPELKRVKIDLKDIDVDILKKIQAEIGHINKLSYYSQKVNIHGTLYDSHIARLVISSEKIVEDLESKGLIKNKTDKLNIDFNSFNENIRFDIIRGLFDGDGCISFNEKTGDITLSLTSSTETINNLISFLKGNGINKIYKYHRNPNNESNATAIIRNKEDCYKFLVKMYDYKTIYLNRKYKKYLNFKKYYEERKLKLNNSNDYLAREYN